MQLQHINAKLLVQGGEGFDLALLIPVFHNWIQNRVFDERLLDIADYRHVPDGPGIILIGLEADYSVDNTDGRLGVRYNRKASLEGSNHDRLKQAVRAALRACQRLEAEPSLTGQLRFNGQEVEIFINDRLLAPNHPATHAELAPEFKALGDALFGGAEYKLVPSNADARRLFSVWLKCSQAFSVEDLLKNLS